MHFYGIKSDFRGKKYTETKKTIWFHPYIENYS